MSAPLIDERDVMAAKAMLEHAFRHVGTDALRDVHFRDVVDAFAGHRTGTMPSLLPILPAPEAKK